MKIKHERNKTVRFRTAIKEPMDIAFLFRSIAVGIVLGAGLLPLAVIGSVIIGIIIVVFSTRKIGDTPYILVINMENGSKESNINETVKKEARKSLLKTKTVGKSGIQLIYEVRIKNGDTDFINKIYSLEGISDFTKENAIKQKNGAAQAPF